MTAIRRPTIYIGWKVILTIAAYAGMVELNREGGPCNGGFGYLFLGPLVLLFGVWSILSSIKLIKVWKSNTNP
jgi:hypothetical protein